MDDWDWAATLQRKKEENIKRARIRGQNKCPFEGGRIRSRKEDLRKTVGGGEKLQYPLRGDHGGRQGNWKIVSRDLNESL